MLLAIDQGTTGTTCLVFDLQGELLGRALPRVHPALPAAGLGRARRGRDLGRHARGRRRGARGRRRAARRARGDRHHEPARDRRRAGTRRPASRCTARSSGRTAAPPARCDELRDGRRGGPRSASGPASCSTRTSRRRRSSGCCATSTGSRERARDGRAVFGTIDAWLLFKLTGEHAHRPSQRLAHAAAATSPTGDWDAELLDLFGGARSARCPRCGRAAASSARTRAGRLPRLRRCRSPASPATSRPRCSGRAAWSPGSARTRTAPARSCSLNAGTSVAARRRRGCSPTIAWQIGAPDHLRARGGDLRHRRRRAVAARRARHHRRGGRDRGRWPRRWTPTTASTSSPR